MHVMWTPGMTMADMEKTVINAALQFYRGNKSQTAVALDISVRTIDNKLAEYARKDAETYVGGSGISREHEAMLRQKREIADAVEREAADRRNGVEPSSQVAEESTVPVRESEEIQEVLSSENAANYSGKGNKPKGK